MIFFVVFAVAMSIVLGFAALFIEWATYINRKTGDFEWWDL